MPSNPDDWTVEIVTKGRDGNVIYHEGSQSTSFYWEFGGGDVIVIINIGSLPKDTQDLTWPANRRKEILERVMSEVIRQKAPNCIANIDEDKREIQIRKQSSG